MNRLQRTALASALAMAGMSLVALHEVASDSDFGEKAFLATTIGNPLCLVRPLGKQANSFFRLAMAREDGSPSPQRSEVGPFTRVIPTAESIARADSDPVLAEDLGSLHLPIRTRNPRAQKYFDQGLRLAYAFNHAEALRAFRKARRLDPACALCYWGEALVMGPNINAPMEAALTDMATEAAAKAVTLAADAPPKERALTRALAERYRAGTDRAALDAAYAEAMGRVAREFPTDDHVQVLYAEALMNLQPWDYWEAGGNQPKGRTAEILAALETVLRRNPDHAGAVHFYIHITEASSDPGRALPHARRLGRLMPGAGHLVHMPFHTFYRVGLYRDALEANRAAVAADERYIARSAPAGIYPAAYYPHNVHSLMVSAQMAGDGSTVLAAADKLGQIVTESAVREIGWVQPIKVAPYFAHAQFGNVRTLSALADPGSEFPYVRAMWHYARGGAFAQARDLENAGIELRAIDTLATTNDFADLAAAGVPAKEILQIARHVVQARIHLAAGDAAAAAAAYREAVALEDLLAYSEPPYWYYPIRQSLGAALLIAGNTAEAESAFRESLARVPNNGWALFGLRELYARRGEPQKAAALDRQLEKAWAGERSQLKLDRL